VTAQEPVLSHIYTGHRSPHLASFTLIFRLHCRQCCALYRYRMYDIIIIELVCAFFVCVSYLFRLAAECFLFGRHCSWCLLHVFLLAVGALRQEVICQAMSLTVVGQCSSCDSCWFSLFISGYRTLPFRSLVLITRFSSPNLHRNPSCSYVIPTSGPWTSQFSEGDGWASSTGIGSGWRDSQPAPNRQRSERSESLFTLCE